MTGSRAVMFAAAAIGALLLGFIGLLATSDASPGSLNSNALVDKVAPLVSGPTLDGDRFDLAEHRGQWVLVNFFATDCPGCITEHPELVEFMRRHEASGSVEVVSVNFGDDPRRIAAFFEKNGGDWPVIVDGDAAQQFAMSFGVTAVPETYIITPSGRVGAKLIGSSGVTADQLDAALGLATQG